MQEKNINVKISKQQCENLSLKYKSEMPMHNPKIVKKLKGISSHKFRHEPWVAFNQIIFIYLFSINK